MSMSLKVDKMGSGITREKEQHEQRPGDLKLTWRGGPQIHVRRNEALNWECGSLW